MVGFCKVVLGRGRATKVKEARCSRVQLCLTADLANATVRYTIRVAPDIRPAGYPTFFDIRYPVSFAGDSAGYPAGRIAGYPARKT